MEDKEKLKDINQLSKSCVHIYCGDGKGKTTAALGLAVRAACRGKKALGKPMGVMWKFATARRQSVMPLHMDRKAILLCLQERVMRTIRRLRA